MDSAAAKLSSALRNVGEVLDGTVHNFLHQLDQATLDLPTWPNCITGLPVPGRLPSVECSMDEMGRSPVRATSSRSALWRWGEASPYGWSPPPRWPAEAATLPEAESPGQELFLSELRAAERLSRATGKPFADSDFERPVKGRVASWCRPYEINRHDGRPVAGSENCMCAEEAKPQAWQLFRGAPRADDVLQGELGDCWFLSSLAALAEFRGGRFVRALLPGQDSMSPHGVYVVRLCLGGRWRGVLVDDRLPCLGGFGYYTQLAFCVTHRLQLWASLIEKGYAKACGSYEALRGGESAEALSALTGWPCTLIRFDRRDFDADILWATLCSARDAEFLMTCSTRNVKASSLMPDHVYSLMTVYEVEDEKRGHLRLVKIRNPNGLTKWQGAWSDGSPHWTPELRKELDCPEGGQQGVFFMAYSDFLQEFAHCTICRIRSDEWHEVREPIELAGVGVPCFGLPLEVSETAECCLSLAQPEERIRKGPFCKDLEGALGCIGFVVLTGRGLEGLMGPAGGEAVVAAHMRARANVSADCWLQPGQSYTMVPLCLDPHESAEAHLPATCACVSSRPVGLGGPRALEVGTVKVAWASYARMNDPSPVSFHGALLHMGKAQGGSIVAFAENRGKGSLQVELTLTSDTLRFSRGRAKTSDWLAPGYGQILQVAQPNAPDGFCAGWRSQHKFCMVERRPQKPQGPEHNPALPNETINLHAPFRLAD